MFVNYNIRTYDDQQVLGIKFVKNSLQYQKLFYSNVILFQVKENQK